MSIELRHISKTFGPFRALDDINLVVPDGGLVALLGPSGCGKTTLLRIISGLETPDPGDASAILFRQQQVLGQDVRARQVGFVFQHYALFRHMTVAENIAFGLRILPRRARPAEAAIRARVAELLHLIQLAGLEGRYPSQLSGGQRQRVALARALAIEPKVLLLDEPFGALDARVRLDLRRWLRRLHDELHVTSVFVTHDQEEALEVADRVVVMNRGRIEQEGTPDEVFHHPASEFVMGFLGSVNLFHGRIEGGKAVSGPIVVDTVAAAGDDGKSAKLFVRPHELELFPWQEERGGLRAAVIRVQSAGSVVKIELRSRSGQALNVELPHERFRELGVQPGQDLLVAVREARVFVDDYAI
ncbi:MAG TPA: TOBE-like domain-containing protein [bacterium]